MGAGLRGLPACGARATLVLAGGLTRAQTLVETMKDPKFIEEARRIGVDVNPLDGAEIAKIMREIDAAPQDAIDSLKKILN